MLRVLHNLRPRTPTVTPSPVHLLAAGYTGGASARGAGDRGSIPNRVTPKT